MDVFNDILGAAGVSATAPGDILTALALSFGLMVVIGAVYQRTHRGQKYSQDYVHMLIMMGVLVSVVIMGIAGDAARAFGVFAAFSIIRFRRTLPEARDIGFVFFAMAVGLAVGGHLYALAVLTTLLVCGIIVVMSSLDWFAPRRDTHQLRIRITNEIDHATAFGSVFDRMLERQTLLSIESVQAGLLTELNYAVQLKAGADPLELVKAIQARNGNNRVILRALATGELDDD